MALKFREVLVTLKIFPVFYPKQVIKCLVVLKGEVFNGKANEISSQFKKVTNFGKLYLLY